MRLPCNLRVIRGDRSLRDLADASGVPAGELSRIENGIALPRDKDLDALEAAYGYPIEAWYQPRVLLAMQLEPDARVQATVHVASAADR